MPGIVCVGVQWGDEGKGKIVDILSESADLVVRYAGGNNAGHTVIVDSTEYILHLIPSGIIRPGKKCLLANGVVIDPVALLNEIEQLKKKGLTINSNLMISENAHVIMPYHRVMDGLRETNAKFQKIGTTKRGIGPCYVDKVGRIGIRIIDLMDPERFKELVQANLAEKNPILKDIYQHEGYELQTILDEYLPLADKIKPFVVDGTIVVNDALDNNETVLFEGAQGTLLDVDFGTYPYVTSSNTGVSGVCSGAGIAPTKINRIYGVAKAYCTRVGEGPFPTELSGEEDRWLRNLGSEYGATTGRPRRCGWFDFVSTRRSVRVNGITDLVITKMDILDSSPSIKVCAGYEYQGKILKEFPNSIQVLSECKPILEEIPGWQTPTTKIRKRVNLPENARKYIERIEKELKTPVSIVSIGAHRDQTILE